MKNLLKKRIPLLLTIILGLGLTLGAVYFMYYKRDERLSNLTTGLIKLDFKEKSNVIKLNDDVPVVDAAGLQRTPYTFTVENIGQKTINLNIKVDVKQNTNIPLGAVRYGVFINDELVRTDYIHDDKILYTYEELLVNEIIECKLRFWIDYYYDQENKEFEALIEIEGESRDIIYEGVQVTFDANGGTVDTQSKEVAVGENYGRLPTPTREGYTFKGWNGKNMFDEESILMAIDGATYDNEHYIFKLVKSHEKYNNGIETISFKQNTQYTMTIKGYVDPCLGCNSNYNRLYFGYTYNNNTIESVAINSLTESNFIFISNENKNLESIFMSYGAGGQTNAYISSVQLEEGSVATEYEPYYITSDTKVVQNKDHTLKAIWKENS